MGCIKYNPPTKDTYPLTKEDMEWLSGDTCAVFQSNRGGNDTIQSERYGIRQDTIVQSERLFTCRNKGYKFFILECIQRLYSAGVSITFRKKIENPDNPDIQVYNRQIESQKYRLKGKTYDECIVINNWDTDSLFYYKRKTGGNVSHAVFAKGIGLIFYKMEDGEEFTRIFN